MVCTNVPRQSKLGSSSLRREGCYAGLTCGHIIRAALLTACGLNRAQPLSAPCHLKCWKGWADPAMGNEVASRLSLTLQPQKLSRIRYIMPITRVCCYCNGIICKLAWAQSTAFNACWPGPTARVRRPHYLVCTCAGMPDLLQRICVHCVREACAQNRMALYDLV